MRAKNSKSMKELKRAGIAGVITILGAIVVSAFLPDIHDYLMTRSEDVRLVRSYDKTSDGGYIIYKNIVGEGEERYIEDLEILSRRFMRGQFEMASIPGSSDSPSVIEIAKLAPSFRYEVIKREGNPALRIIAPPSSVLTVHSYFDFLSERWNVSHKASSN